MLALFCFWVLVIYFLKCLGLIYSAFSILFSYVIIDIVVNFIYSNRTFYFEYAPLHSLYWSSVFMHLWAVYLRFWSRKNVDSLTFSGHFLENLLITRMKIESKLQIKQRGALRNRLQLHKNKVKQARSNFTKGRTYNIN